MADIPASGYQQSDVPEADVWNLMATFDQTFSEMLRLLEKAWATGDDQWLGSAVSEMIQMASLGKQLVQKPKPGGGTFGPCFRYVP